jgi:hypothetical protein
VLLARRLIPGVGWRTAVIEMIDERHDPDFIANAAGTLLSKKFGEGIRLRKGKIFTTGASIVVRCEVLDARPDLPASLIVKKVREDEFGYQPDSAESPNPAHWLFNDWAAAEFLNNIPSTVPLSPLLYGGSREFGLVVLEDLGDGEAPNTSDALLGADPALAEQTLIEHVSLVGQLHALTIGREAEYRRVRARLGTLPKPARLYQDPWSDARNYPIQTSEMAAAIKLYRTVFAHLGVQPATGIAAEIESVTSAVEAYPKRFLAFCKGDQNAAGDYMRRNGQPRLFDFNAGGYRHALIEGMPGRMTWGCLMRLPARILPLLDRAYQAQFTQRHAEISDEMFHQAMVEAGARWHILHVVHRLPDALTGDRQRGLTTLRQQVVAWLTAFADLSEEFCGMPALGLSARRMAERLRDVWPAEASNMPYYPAFRHDQ